MGISSRVDGAVAEVVIDRPPVNAMTVQDWFDIAEAVTAAGRNPNVAAVVLAAEGRGFCAGADIKEIQREGDSALIGCNRGCFEAFAAVYECEVPVIAAVQGFCMGGGIGLVGNSDIVVAAEDAVFGLPEVDRGALGAATHLSRLVPQQLMRQMVYSCRQVPVAELVSFGTIAQVVPTDELRKTARAVADDIATRSPYVIRRAKESLNGIDPMDVRRSYRFEQGFTFELHASGIADEARQAFVDKRRPSYSR